MPNLPTIRSIVDQYGLLPNNKHSKRYGQNFIFDETVTERIAKFARLPSDALVLEVGPGPGGLTRSILNQKPAHVVALEYDPLCVNALSYLHKFYENMTIMQADALTVPLTDVLKAGNEATEKLYIVSNLPYNIGTELLVRWLSQLGSIASMTLMFQKEVALRIQARPGTKDYGRLSILTQMLCDVEHGFDLPPTVFTPAPKVESSVIHIRPRADALPLLPLIPTLSEITNIVFQQRRKQIKGPLKAIFGDETLTALESVGATGDLRAENLTPEQYVKLARLKHGK